jgi:hypothetical protein
MTDDRAAAAGKPTSTSRRGAARKLSADASVAELEALAADLVRQLGAQRARYLAALLDEAAEAAETRP